MCVSLCYSSSQHGAGVTDHSIFTALTRHWEEQYHVDMTALNVRVQYVCLMYVMYLILTGSSS